MPRNGSGVYSLPPTYNPVVNGTTIDPTAFNTTMTDLANAMTASVAADGETPVTGNLPMAGFKHTGAGAATAAGQYTVFGQSAAQFTTLGVGAAPLGMAVDVAGGIRSQGSNVPSSGIGAEIGYDGTNALFQGYNRTSALSIPVRISGSLIQLLYGSTVGATLDASGNVGIGVTPSVRLHALQTAAGSTVGRFANTGATTSFTAANFTNGTDADLNIDITGVGAVSKLALVGPNVSIDLAFKTSGTERMRIDNVGRLSGTALHNNSSLPSGTNQYIASGTYTPTLTNLANFSSISALTAQWMRVGNVVTVSGEFNATAAASSTVSMGISLPIASTLGTSGACSGVMPGHNGSTSPGGITGYIKGDTVNNRAQGTVLNDGFNGAGTWGFYFTYVVL